MVETGKKYYVWKEETEHICYCVHFWFSSSYGKKNKIPNPKKKKKEKENQRKQFRQRFDLRHRYSYMHTTICLPVSYQ